MAPNLIMKMYLDKYADKPVLILQTGYYATFFYFWGWNCEWLALKFGKSKVHVDSDCINEITEYSFDSWWLGSHRSWR